MSGSVDLSSRPPQGHQVLGELLHSMSQPLTSLYCSLELSIDEAVGRRPEAVSVALEQAEKVIGMVRLMREYLDTDLGTWPPHPVALAPALSAVVEELSSVAATRRVRLQLTGTCTALVLLAEGRLRLALQYLISALIEPPTANCEIALRIEEDPSETVLSAQVAGDSTDLQPRPDPVSFTLRRVKLAIASRVLESAGASLTFDNGNQSAFVLRIPNHPTAPLSAEHLA